MLTEELIIYKKLKGSEVIDFFSKLNNEDENIDIDDVKKKFAECISFLVELAFSHGYSGNLWQSYLTYLLANNENPYSKACEIKGNMNLY